LKQLNEPLPKLRQFTVDLPKEVEFSVLKMMAKDPENRYSDMNAVATMLEKVAIQQFSIRDQTGYFDIDLDQVDEQTRYDQASSQVKVQTAKAVNESNRLKSVPSSDQTIDQVGSLEAKLEPVMGKLENFGGTNISALEEKSKGSKVSKKWSLTLIGILAVGFTIITLLSSNQTKKYLPVPTETNQVAVVETSNPIDTAQLAKTSIIMITPTQVENFVPNSGIGSTKISEIDGMEMVYVPAGNFLMGNDRNDAYSHESPLHKVYLDAYWIDKYEVTNAQYRKCEQSGFCDRPNQVNSATHSSYYEDLQFDEHPVVYVSWNDAQTYCQWAGRELPTEAQWEKAARGTDGGNYPWGNEAPTSKLLNYNSNAGDTAEVGSYPAGASPNGAMDMAGNVFEWVSDWYDANYYSISPLENPQGPINGNKRVIRGGSWGSFEWDVRPSARNWIFPDGVGNVYGFRCSTLN